MKTPYECRDMADVRAAIGSLDHGTVRLLGERAKYVHAAAKFKTSASSVKARDRQRAMLEERREWAAEHDLDPGFVGREMEGWESSR